MKQKHTEGAIDHTDGEQNTGNHKVDDTASAKGADRFGGTRAGAQNIESSDKHPEGANQDATAATRRRPSPD